MKIKLDRQELSIAKQASALRYQLARAAGVEDKLIGTNHSTADVDLVGIKAEIAVAKLFGCDFDPNTLGIDSGVDMYVKGLSGEMAVQVKSSHHAHPKWLLIKADPDDDWDVAILVASTDSSCTMNIVGCISKSRCVDGQEIVDLGHGRSSAVSVKHLKDVKELWRSVNG